MSLVASLGSPAALIGAGLVHVDQLAALVGIRHRDQFGRRQLDEIGIGVEAGPVGVGQLLGLDEQVPVIGGLRPHLLEIVRGEDIEHLQDGDALARRRQLPDLVAAIVRADRLDPGRGVIGEILERKQPADLVRIGDDLLGDHALVENLRAFPRDRLVDPAQVRILEHVAGPGRVAIGEIGRQGIRRFAQAFLGLGPPSGDDLGDRKALLGVLDGRTQNIREGQLAELLMQVVPARNAAGHRPGQRAVFGNLLQLVHLEVFARGLVGRAAAGVEAVQLLGLVVPDDGEQVAADAARHRFHEPQGGVGGDGGVHGRAPLTQNIEPDLRGQRLAGRDHAVPGHDDRTARLIRLRREASTQGTFLTKAGCVHAKEHDVSNNEALEHGKAPLRVE